MKIAFITPVNGISGGLYVVYQHAHHLADRGHEVEILIASLGLGLKVNCYPGFRLRTRSLEEAIESKTQYDILIATWWETFFDLFMLPAGRYLYFVQSDERRFYPSGSPEIPRIEETYRCFAVGYITEARWIKDWLDQEFGIKAAYAPNGVDTRLFHPSVKPLFPKKDRIRVLVEGPGNQPFKRLDLAFRVVAQVPNIEVWFVNSDGFTRPQWKYQKRFTHVPLQKMPRIYRSCDILVKLSVVEGFFGPPLEMMACGGTALVSKVTGWEEYVRDEENALVVDLDNEEQAVAALKRLVESKELRDRLSAEGLRTAQGMDWTERCREFADQLERMAEEIPQSNASVSESEFYWKIRQPIVLRRSEEGRSTISLKKMTRRSLNAIRRIIVNRHLILR